jgi:hypothetical protein
VKSLAFCEPGRGRDFGVAINPPGEIIAGFAEVSVPVHLGVVLLARGIATVGCAHTPII